MLEQGVIDPVKVTRSAVQNAVSIAGHDPDDRGADHRHPRGEAGDADGGGMPGGGMDF